MQQRGQGRQREAVEGGCDSVRQVERPAQPSLAEQIKACTDAIAAGKDEGDGAPECTDLSPDDYFKALQAANKQVQDAFQKQTDEAASKAANGSN
ncbi:hypothetical protein ACWCQN_28105 [Streptomyces sp. NPDC001984]